MPIAPLLQAFVVDELSRAGSLVERTVAGTLQLLRDPKDSGLAAGERSLQLTLVEALQRQGDAYRAAFAGALHRGVMRELQTQDAGAPPADAGSGGLELMDESRVEVDIEISRALQIIDTTAEWELRELQTFTSTLCGQQHVSAESNPLRPLVYANALWEAACAVSSVPVQRSTLLRVSSGVIAGLLRTVWAAACTRLETQGVQPGTYRTVLLAPGSTPDRSPHRTPEFDVTQPGALGSLLHSMPGGGPAASSPHAGERQVVELLSRVFALIQGDKDLPAGLRAVLARLQVSALRVAMTDPAMLESHAHPVWLLMDRIGEAGRLYPAASDARLAALQSFCEAIAEEVSRTASADAAMFRRELARVAAFLTEQVQWQLREAQAAVGTLQRAEQRDVLEQRLSLRLAEQMTSVRSSPAIRRFVTGAWAKVLAESMTRHGENTEPTPSFVKTVDDLLWSLNTPNHPQSRQRLVTLLPVLLQRLRSGMALIDLPASEQQAVLDELMAVHTEALRPTARQGDAAQTAQEIVQRLRDEVIPDTPGRTFSDSVIDLGSMETVPADFMNTNIQGDDGEAAPKRVEALAAGARQRLFLHGRWMRVQLLWRSEQGLYFLFAGETPGRTHSITRRALERLEAAGLMQPLETKPLVQRTLDALLNQLPS